MPWPKAEEIQSWKDICEKFWGIKFNNGKEITSYPITKRENLANPSNEFTLACYDKEPCDKPVSAGTPVRACSYGQIFARIYHILMKEYANKPFNKTNLNAFLKHVGPDEQSWRNFHQGVSGSTKLLLVIGKLASRLELTFAEATIENDDADDRSEGLPQIALGLEDSRGNDLARVPVKRYNSNSTFDSVLTSMKDDVLDTVKSMPAPPTAPYINLGVEGWLDASLELKWTTDEKWLMFHRCDPDGKAANAAKKQKNAKTLFEKKLEDYVKLDLRGVEPTSNVSAYLNSARGRRLRSTLVRGQAATVIPIVVRIAWEKLKKAVSNNGSD